MAFFTFQCVVCGLEFKTKTKEPTHCELPCEKLLIAPSPKLMEKDTKTGKSRLMDFDKITTERARNHLRDVETDDLIQKNKGITNPQRIGWLSSEGKKRTKIDDK
jgi:hypothetical protein